MNLRAFITLSCSSVIIYLGIMILLKKENTDLNELLFYKFFEVKNKNKFRIASGTFYLAMGVIFFLVGIGDLLKNKILIEVMRYFTIILLPILAINVLRLLSLRR